MLKRLPILIMLFVALQFTSQAQITVEETQRSIFTKITATWCPNCGTWGWTFMENMIDEIDDKAIVIGAHYSGDLGESVSQDWTSNFNVNGQPRFVLNNIDLGINSSNHTSKVMEVMNNIDNFAEQTPVANVGLEAVYTASNEMVVFTNTKFFQDASGRYTLALYVLEDEVIANQAGQGSMTVHPKVMRMAIGDSFGEEIVNGNAAAGMEVAGQYTMAIDPEWDLGNISVLGVIWQEVNGTNLFVNAFEDNTFAASTSNKSVLAEQVEMNVMPNIITDVANITLNLTESVKDAEINLIDLTGKELSTIFSGDLMSGTHSLSLERSKVSSNGIYLLQMQSANGVITKKVIFQ